MARVPKRMTMPRSSLLRCALSAILLATALSAVPASAARTTAGDDAVVVAVIDSGMSPYHWDFLAAKMPQAKTKTKADDLPLTKAPHTWLAGFPSPKVFGTYESLDLTLDAKNPKRLQADLFDRDEDAWLDVETSTADEPAYYWIPGTKVVGALSFGGDGGTDYKGPIYGTGVGEHGQGTASVSVGNMFGTCPECLLVFIQASSGAQYEAAIEWAENQPWIDAISNSYGLSTSPARDRVYAGSDTALQKKATERGQEIFFSAGNGVLNDFVTPNGTLLSSQEGPDWIVTVGATDPADVDYSGAGKPADIAGIGTMYPSAYSGKDVTGKGDFSGTSNATPTIAGTYARALWLARQALAGPSRVQSRGVVATGKPYRCGAARKNCELADGTLTRRELEIRLFEGARPTKGGYAGRRTVPRSTALGLVPIPPPVGGTPVPFLTTPAVADERRLSEGYGTYRGRLDGDKKWLREFETRIWDVLTGESKTPRRPSGDVEWFRVDSWCRQRIWGSWSQGAYLGESKTPLPAPDPAAPSRTAYRAACESLVKPPSR